MNYKEVYFNHLGLDKCDTVYCANCGRIANQIHHIKYKSQGGKDIFSNLIALCFGCHSDHHTKNKPTTKELAEIKKKEL